LKSCAAATQRPTRSPRLRSASRLTSNLTPRRYHDRPVFRGTDALRRFIDEGPWAGTIHFEPERFFDIDDERVLVFVRVSAIGQESVVPPLGLRE